MPLITILIASFNRLEFLKECVKSAIDQELFDNYEIIIVDDGSSKETKDWLNKINDPKVEVIFQNNKGVASARQVGLEAANGVYVLILDSDDMLALNALNIINREIIKFPKSCLFYTNNIERYPNGKERFSAYPSFHNHEMFSWSIMTKARVPFKHSGTTYKRDDAISFGGYNTSLKLKIDIDFILRFLETNKEFRFINEPLVIFNFHKDSISRNRISGICAWWGIIDNYFKGNRLIRSFLKIWRVFIELSKLIYEVFSFNNYSPKSE